MAFYYNLAIDFGSNQSGASEAMESFKGFQIENLGNDIAPVLIEEISLDEVRGLWIVGIWPKGMAYGIQEDSRYELFENEENLKRIEQRFLDALKSLKGYRRALFGAEAVESFTGATPEEDDDIDWIGLVFSKDHFPEIPESIETKAFTDGYLRVASVSR